MAGAAAHPIFHLAIPPSLFGTVANGIAGVGLDRGARLIIEKPFGRDHDSAVDLNATLHEHFPESAIFRIDHFIGKEAMRSLLVTRFANAIIEPLWNRGVVSSVKITMAEAFGVEDRGAFYDSVGALRDVMQNHLLQMVALLGDGAAGQRSARRRFVTRRPRCSRPPGPSSPSTTCAASTTATSTSPACSPAPTPRPTAPSDSTSTRPGGAACRSSCGRARPSGRPSPR